MNLFGSYKFVGAEFDDPEIRVTRVINAQLLETFHEGKDEYRQIGEFSGVDAFVVQISQKSGIGLAGSAGVAGDPTQSDVGKMSSSTSVQTFIYIADFGSYRDLLEDPYEGPQIRQKPTFNVQVRSAE